MHNTLDFHHAVTGEKLVASAGNRTRAARVAGEHSTTEPPMLAIFTGPEQQGRFSKVLLKLDAAHLTVFS